MESHGEPEFGHTGIQQGPTVTHLWRHKTFGCAFKFAKVLGDFEAKPESVPMTYDVPESGKIEVEVDLSKLAEALGGSQTAKSRETARIAVSANDLIINGDDGKSLTFSRME